MQRHAYTHGLTFQRVQRALSAVHRQSGTGAHSAGYAENRGDTQVQFLDEMVDTPVSVYPQGE